MDAGARVAIYARYSSDRQNEASIEDQVHRAKQWIAAQGGAPDRAAVFTDYAVSGASLDRPAMQQLLAAISANNFDVMVAESVDRMSRHMDDRARFRKLLMHHRVAFHGLDGTVVKAKDKSAALMFGMRSMFAEQFLADLSDKTLRGLEGRARARKATGAVAYGYRITEDKASRSTSPRLRWSVASFACTTKVCRSPPSPNGSASKAYPPLVLTGCVAFPAAGCTLACGPCW